MWKATASPSANWTGRNSGRVKKLYDALIGAILELGSLTRTPAPTIEAVYACVKLLNRTMLLEGAGVRVGDAA